MRSGSNRCFVREQRYTVTPERYLSPTSSPLSSPSQQVSRRHRARFLNQLPRSLNLWHRLPLTGIKFVRVLSSRLMIIIQGTLLALVGIMSFLNEMLKRAH